MFLPAREQELAGEQPDQPGIDAAKKIGKHLLKDFNPEAYPNPGENLDVGDLDPA